MTARTSFILALLLTALGVTLRFLPHPANVAPIAALALFSGAYLRRWYAFAVPLLAMIVSDYFIGFHSIIWVTWGCFALTGILGLWIRRHINTRRLVIASLTGSVLFYLVTNWAVWAYTELYPRTYAGLMASYVAALPFFRNTLLGDVFYTGVFFGLAALVARLAQQPQAVIVTNHEQKN